MKITRDWLERTNHCPDGRAWGDIELGAGGLELSECWPKIKRADWMLSMIVQTKTRGMHWAFAETQDALRSTPSSFQAKALAKQLQDAEQLEGQRVYASNNFLHALRHEAATEAFIVLKIHGDMRAAWECEAVALTCLAFSEWGRLCDDKALEYLQGAWNMLGKSHGHEPMAARLSEAAGLCSTKKTK